MSTETTTQPTPAADPKGPRRYIDPYLAGALLGVVLFLSFFVLHTYLTTTGPSLGEHVRSMLTGFRSAPAADSHPQGA